MEIDQPRTMEVEHDGEKTRRQIDYIDSAGEHPVLRKGELELRTICGKVIIVRDAI